MLRPQHPLHFFVALVAAVLLWYGLAGQQNENISVRGVKAALTLVNMPRNLVLMSSVPDTISLQLRGPLTKASMRPPVSRSISIWRTRGPAPVRSPSTEPGSRSPTMSKS